MKDIYIHTARQNFQRTCIIYFVLLFTIGLGISWIFGEIETLEDFFSKSIKYSVLTVFFFLMWFRNAEEKLEDNLNAHTKLKDKLSKEYLDQLDLELKKTKMSRLIETKWFINFARKRGIKLKGPTYIDSLSE